MIDEKFTTCYTAVSRMLLRDILESQPLNRWQAEQVVKSATDYKKYWDRENLEIARKIYKRLQEEKGTGNEPNSPGSTVLHDGNADGRTEAAKTADDMAMVS